jgi:orotidine-5'-phosphate decarboxylase
MEELGFHETSPQRLVVRLARLAKEAGVSGVVASAQEAEIIRAACGGDFVIVTPGIRTNGSTQRDDQKRVVTPEEAVRRGADYLVVGRPIIKAPDPVAAADGILEAMAAGLAGRGEK